MAAAGTQKDPPHLAEGQKTEETWADLLLPNKFGEAELDGQWGQIGMDHFTQASENMSRVIT